MNRAPTFFKPSHRIASAGLVLAMIITASGCSSNAAVTKAAEITVETQAPLVTTLSKELSFSSSLRPHKEVTVIPKVSGTVTAVLAQVGDYVEENAALFVIDDKDLSLQLEQAYSGLMTARANYERLVGAQLDQSLLAAENALSSARLQLDAAQTSYDNTLALFEAGAYSQQQLDAADRQLQSAKMAFESAELSYSSTRDVLNPSNERTALAALNQAQATYDLTQSSVSNALVRAPFSGYVSQSTVTKGALVSPQTAAMVLSDISVLEAPLSVTQNVISSLSVGQSVEIEISSVSGRRLEGTIAAVSPSANSATGVFSVKVELENKDLLIKGGMFATVFVPIERVVDVLTVPVSAVLQDDAGDYAYVDEDGYSVRKEVTVGFITDTRCEILEGLTLSDMVIVKGQTYVSPGSSIVTSEQLAAKTQEASGSDSSEADSGSSAG